MGVGGAYTNPSVQVLVLPLKSSHTFIHSFIHSFIIVRKRKIDIPFE